MKNKIVIGDTVIMPEPNDTDIYHFGGFSALVVDIRDDGNLIVEDGDSDFYEIEPDRVTLDKE